MKNGILIDDPAAPQDPSPEFQDWVLEMQKDGFLKLIIEALGIADKEYADPQKALNFLQELSEEQDLADLKLACADFKSDKVAKGKMAELRKALKQKTEKNVNFICGQIGHSIMPRLVMGEIFKPLKHLPKTTPGQLMQLSFDFTEKQLSLFNGPFKTAFLSGQEAITSDFIDGRRIEKKWLRALEIIEKNNSLWPDWYWGCKRIIDDLFLLLSPLLGNHTQRLLRYNNPADREFISLSILTWAAAVTHFRKTAPRIIFPEIPVLRYGDDIHGGRLDAVEVTDINGRPPSKKQKRSLRELAKYRSGSLPQLLKNIELVLGSKDFGLNVSDWKFFVGDCGGKNNLLLAQDLPQKKHIEQLARYLVFCSFGNKLAEPNRCPDFWSGFNCGELTYLLPTSSPFLHQVALGQSDKQRAYASQVLNKLDEAERRATMRKLTNGIVRHIIRRLENKKVSKNQPVQTSQNGKNGKNGHDKNGQTSLFPEVSAKKIISGHKSEREKTIDEMIQDQITQAGSLVPAKTLALYDKEFTPLEKERKFLDPLKIVEEIVSKRDGEEKYIMHLDRLFAAIEQGQMPTKGIRAKGGFIRCVYSLVPPEHPKYHADIHPTLYIWMPRFDPAANSFYKGGFKCFACGIHGQIDSRSIPKDLLGELQIPASFDLEKAEKWSGQATSEIVIPAEHSRIMSSAQEILRAQFKSSKAEQYISKERYLDPELAFKYGAGFGNDRFINEMLDSGYSLDDLIFYGFVGVSENITSGRGLGPLLKRRGLDENQIRREIDVMLLSREERKKMQKQFGYPYSTLRDRVTFPLVLTNMTTSFYGRATYACDKEFRHYKLSTQRTNVPHGAFNADVLYSEHEEVIVAEAVMEALTLIQMGYPSSMAIIGIDNSLLIETIANAQKSVAIALNNDPPKPGTEMRPGQEATKRLTQNLTRRGLAVRDFTAQFMAEHPDMAKDFNETWIGWKKQNRR